MNFDHTLHFRHSSDYQNNKTIPKNDLIQPIRTFWPIKLCDWHLLQRLFEYLHSTFWLL